MGIIYVRKWQKRKPYPKAGPVTRRGPDGSRTTQPAYSRNALAQIKGGAFLDTETRVVGDKKYAPCEICGHLMGVGSTHAGAFLFCSNHPSHFTEQFRQNNRRKRKGGVSNLGG